MICKCGHAAFLHRYNNSVCIVTEDGPLGVVYCGCVQFEDVDNHEPAPDPRAQELLERLTALDPDALSPRAALELLYELHRAAEQ